MKTKDKRSGLLKDISKKYDSSNHPKAANMLARLGLKNYQIYILFNISEPTGVSWYRKIEEFNLAIKDGRANKVDFSFAPVCGEIELRENISELIIENKRLEEQNERLKDELNLKYRPANPEHEKQMRLLDDAIAKSNYKPVQTKPENRKSSIEEQLGITIIRLKDLEIDNALKHESREERQIRWNERKFYSLADFFCSETEEDRRLRYSKKIFTDEERADMTPNW